MSGRKANIGVSSTQMAQIRRALRGSQADIHPTAATAVVYKGTNASIKHALGMLPKGSRVRALLPYIKGNIALVFTNDNICAVLDVLERFNKPYRWRAGDVSEAPIILPAGPTGRGPEFCAMFHHPDLDVYIPTKIRRGQIEITH